MGAYYSQSKDDTIAELKEQIQNLQCKATQQLHHIDNYSMQIAELKKNQVQSENLNDKLTQSHIELEQKKIEVQKIMDKNSELSQKNNTLHQVNNNLKHMNQELLESIQVKHTQLQHIYTSLNEPELFASLIMQSELHLSFMDDTVEKQYIMSILKAIWNLLHIDI